MNMSKLRLGLIIFFPIFIVVGLGLTFVRHMMCCGTARADMAEILDVTELSYPPSPDDNLTIFPSPITIRLSDNYQQVEVGYFNNENNNMMGAHLYVPSCEEASGSQESAGTHIPIVIESTNQDTGPYEVRGWRALLRWNKDIPAGTYECELAVQDTNNETLVEEAFFLEVVN